MNDDLPKIYKSKQTFNDDVGLKIVLKINGKSSFIFEILSDLLNKDYDKIFKINSHSIDVTKSSIYSNIITYLYITVLDNNVEEIEEIYQLLFKYRLEEKI